MKKISIMSVCILMLVCMLSACGKSEDKTIVTNETKQNETSEKVTESETTEKITIENEKPVRLYYLNYAEGEAELIKKYSDTWSEDEDLACFAAFVSDQDVIAFSSETEAHQEDWDSIESDVNYQIGYEISFDVNGESKRITILEPKDIEDSKYLFMGDVDTEEVTGYMGVWVYDDYHQDGGFYTHVLSDEFDENTLLTSIKLRPTPKSGELDNLKLKVFSYSSELEFDDEGYYNGDYGYEISIENN